MNAKTLLLTFALCALPVQGQTVSEIKKAYGEPMLAYSVTEHIWMTPDFAADGQLCRMRFHPKRVYRDTIYADAHLNSHELKWILNQVAPPSTRGEKAIGFGMTTLGGGSATTEYEYEKVSFTFGSSVNFVLSADVLKKSDAVLLDFWLDEAPPQPPKPSPPSESDFDTSFDTEIVILRWNDRTCAEDKKDALTDNPAVTLIERQFGQPQKIYSVSSFTSATTDFAADGEICEMRLFPKRVADVKSYLGTALNPEELQSFFKTLFPTEERNISLTLIRPPNESKSDKPKPDDVVMVSVHWNNRTCSGLE